MHAENSATPASWSENCFLEAIREKQYPGALLNASKHAAKPHLTPTSAPEAEALFSYARNRQDKQVQNQQAFISMSYSRT